MTVWLSQTELDPYDVSPGLLGFLVIFAVALALIGLLVSMSRKIRGVNYRDHADPPTDESHREDLTADTTGDTQADASGVRDTDRPDGAGHG